MIFEGKSFKRTVLANRTFAVVSVFVLAAAVTPRAFAAKEDGCAGGSFTVAAAINRGVISGFGVPPTVQVTGKFVAFQIDTATLGVRNYTLIGGAGQLTKQPLVVFESKLPDLRGAALTSDISVDNNNGSITLQRTGNGISMKIQAVDCAAGGIFQIEPERADGTSTDFTHVLGSSVFYFNNPNFGPPPPPLPLCPAGGPFTPACTPIPITPRVNMASDVAPSFVGRDSPQDATKLSQTGGTSVWRVLSGGRMGGVLGEDSVEVAPPAVPCSSHCKAQDQVKGKYPVLGFPSPVPANARIMPR